MSLAADAQTTALVPQAAFKRFDRDTTTPRKATCAVPWSRAEHHREAVALYVELIELVRRLSLDPDAIDNMPADLARRLLAYRPDEMSKVRAELLALLAH